MAVQGDVLTDLGVDFVADALGGRVGLAMAFVATVKVSMAASLLLAWPITLWPMRQDLLEMLGEYFGATQVSPTAYYALTYASLAAIYAAALAIQSAYRVGGRPGRREEVPAGGDGCGAWGRCGSFLARGTRVAPLPKVCLDVQFCR
jgi:hypothetical protein